VAVTTEHPVIHTQLSVEQVHVLNQQLAHRLKVFAQQATDHVALPQIITEQDRATAVEMVSEQ
jgi:hypothetical protein